MKDQKHRDSAIMLLRNPTEYLGSWDMQILKIESVRGEACAQRKVLVVPLITLHSAIDQNVSAAKSNTSYRLKTDFL